MVTPPAYTELYVALLRNCHVLIFNLLPPPASPPLQPTELKQFGALRLLFVLCVFQCVGYAQLVSLTAPPRCCRSIVSCCTALYCQVLIFNLLPPPGSPPLQPDERGAAWSPPPLAVEVQAQVVDAMERVSVIVAAVRCSCTVGCVSVAHVVGALWCSVHSPLAVELQAQVVDAMERVSGHALRMVPDYGCTADGVSLGQVVAPVVDAMQRVDADNAMQPGVVFSHAVASKGIG
jgi:hypothetical protein